MQMLITIISYLALLLLITPATTVGFIFTILLFSSGLALIIWKKPQIQRKCVSKSTFLIAVLFAVLLGFGFYKRWFLQPEVCAIAATVHISNYILTAIAALCLGACAVCILVGILQKAKEISTTSTSRKPFASNLLYCLIAALATVFLSQLMINVYILSMGILKCLWGTGIVAIVILSLYCLCGKIKISIALGTGLFMILSTANVYVYSFRSRLFEPVDIFSLGTAMNVASNYSLFPIPIGIVIGWGIWIGLLICLFRLCAKTKHSISGKQRLILGCCCLVGAISVFFYTANLKTYHWHKEGASFNGYILDFVSKFKEASISKPDGYSEERIEELADQYTTSGDSTEQEEQLPHIIVIMDESFSDLSVIGEISTNVEVLPFISSLKENVIWGYALSSVYGGNTANSEYEFLTGNSMAWLSPNVVPYQQYIRSSTYSMVSYLKAYYNYQCIAMHPYLSDGWNRPKAYAHLGFDQSFFAEDFPQAHYIRDYISDQEMFETIIETYENQQDGPLFLFGVSMQNHGGYTYSGSNFEQTVSLVGYDQDYPEVEQYLSLIHETDKAVAYLLSYFEAVEEDVIIVFFGDHQPKIDEAFYEALGQGSCESLDELQRRYMVPFFIWANYDIDEAHIERTSLNYLSSFVYEAAGIPLPPYNQFMSQLQVKIPAINANGFYSLESQCYLPFDMASEEELAWLQLYQQLQYNNLADHENRNEDMFPILE